MVAKRIIGLMLCVIAVSGTFASCGGLMESADVTVVTAPTTIPPTTTTPTTTALAQTEAAVPELVSFDVVNKPDENGERRSPNVNYFLPVTNRVGKDYFDDVVFIGDSVTETLKYYNMANGSFGNALFLSSSSLSASNALWDIESPDAYHPLYQGAKVYVYDGVALSGKKKVYVMLGVNELGWSTPKGCIENLLKLTDAVLQKTPDVMFYMQSVTPLSYERGKLNTNAINEYNARLSELCREKGWFFVDVASVFRDKTGHLPEKYCSDPAGMGIHFNDSACEKWVEYLYTHTSLPGYAPVPEPSIFDFDKFIAEQEAATENKTDKKAKSKAETTKAVTVKPKIVEAVEVSKEPTTQKKESKKGE